MLGPNLSLLATTLRKGVPFRITVNGVLYELRRDVLTSENIFDVLTGQPIYDEVT